MNFSGYQDTHLSRSFFMRKTYTVDDKLVFHKKFLRPIALNGNKCLSYLQIKGFKTWLTPFFNSILNNKIDKNRFFITINDHGNEKSVIIPPHIFLYSEWNDIINSIKNTIFQVIQSKTKVFFNFGTALFPSTGQAIRLPFKTPLRSLIFHRLKSCRGI